MSNNKLDIKPNQKVLLKTYELHEGLAGNIEATFFGYVGDDESALVVIEYDYFGKLRKTLWRVKISDILGIKNVKI